MSTTYWPVKRADPLPNSLRETAWKVGPPFSLATILFPVDFSGRSVGAARYVIPLAEHFDSEVTLLHVVAAHHEFLSDEPRALQWTELFAGRQCHAERKVDAVLSAELHSLRVRRALLEGDPAQEIIQYARVHHFDLIMMPTHGYGPFRRLLLGSVTARVLRDAPCPVWTEVHAENAPRVEWIGLRRILCAVDAAPHSAQTLEWASQLAETAAALTLIHVVPRLHAPGEDYYGRRWVKRATAEANRKLEQLQHSVGSNAAVDLGEGNVPEAVCAAAARLRADLLVIGRGSDRGASGRLPTNADAMLRESPCPVVSV